MNNSTSCRAQEIAPQKFKKINIQPIDVIMSWGLHQNYFLSSALEYLAKTAHTKNRVHSNLGKALWYAQKFINSKVELECKMVSNAPTPQQVAEDWGMDECNEDALYAIYEIASLKQDHSFYSYLGHMIGAQQVEY